MLWPEKYQPTGSISSQFQAFNVFALGAEHGEEITMASSEKWKELRDQMSRYRMMEQETTDPLAAGLLRGIVLELEAEMNGERTAACSLAPEPTLP